MLSIQNFLMFLFVFCYLMISCDSFVVQNDLFIDFTNAEQLLKSVTNIEAHHFHVILIHGSSKHEALLWRSKIGNLICLRHLFPLTAVVKFKISKICLPSHLHNLLVAILCQISIIVKYSDQKAKHSHNPFNDYTA